MKISSLILTHSFSSCWHMNRSRNWLCWESFAENFGLNGGEIHSHPGWDRRHPQESHQRERNTGCLDFHLDPELFRLNYSPKYWYSHNIKSMDKLHKNFLPYDGISTQENAIILIDQFWFPSTSFFSLVTFCILAEMQIILRRNRKRPPPLSRHRAPPDKLLSEFNNKGKYKKNFSNNSSQWKGFRLCWK